DDAEEYQQFDDARLAHLDRDTVRQQIVASGLWTTIRTRPFSRIPDPSTEPAAIFVTAVDTSPLAADPAWIINDAGPAFVNGLTVLAHLTAGKVYVNTKPDPGFGVPKDAPFVHSEFDGPHPAGLVGTHIHMLEPVSEHKTVWHIRYQHVVSIGRLFAEGRLPTRRIIALTGPMAKNPRLLRTRIGASTEDLLRDELKPGPVRVISGSALSGHRAAGPLAWLNRYHNQLTVLAEDSPREFLAWAKPGTGKYSASRAFVGSMFSGRNFDLATNQNGSPRAMVSTGSFETVMPLDVLATPLLKALLVEDTDRAKALGCLELDEEDLALCSFVCSGKYDYGPFLRMNLDEIEANG
ncbi:MAG: NADH:ubiquinone reductase (Na(+)-transporting) subunit A, partial [Pseudomonadota bacterium]